MQSRMDKYNNEIPSYKSRTQRNQNLYEDVKNSSLTQFDVKSNISIIDDNAKKINVADVQKMLDKRYNENLPKRKSIDVPFFEDEEVEETTTDTKEYDINIIMKKAKMGKNVDYNRERLKKVRDAQYEILNNLDLEIKKVEEASKIAKTKEAEDNLMNLINTITSLEIENKKKVIKESTPPVEILDELKEEPKPDEPSLSSNNVKVESKTFTPITNNETPNNHVMKKENVESLPNINKENKKIEVKEIKQQDSNVSMYDDFADISKNDRGSIIIKIIIFILVIALIFGAIYILDNILNLGLF